MNLIDYLGDFSVEDLRELARRRGVRISHDARVGRQTLVRSLAAALGQYGSVYSAVIRLNQAELAGLWYLLHHKRSGQSALTEAAQAEGATVRAMLESLRLWGLVFPEGDWEHIHIPPATAAASHYIHAPGGGAALQATPLAGLLDPPVLETASAAALHPRPSSLSWDFAEALARVSRARLKLTQQRRINRRDLRAIEAALSVPVEGYGEFVYTLLAAGGFLLASLEGLLVVAPSADNWLGKPELERTRLAIESWLYTQGYPESAQGDPAEAGYLPPQIGDQRARMVELLASLPDDAAVSVKSIARRLQWLLPMSFQQWNGTRDVETVASRLVRSLYWLGLVTVDEPAVPRQAKLTALGANVARNGSGEGLVPEETGFFLQPNAEIFAPPNLAPWVLFHLRRITGEKKGGPAGMYPLTADSVRRALDSGLTVPQLATFLERFSRTGLPGNVRTLVETAGRQHGRIRLVPTQWVLVADDPELMKELRSLKTISGLVGTELTERSAMVADGSIANLMRQLRTRGYAPLNQAEVGDTLSLPDDPATPPLRESDGQAGHKAITGPEGEGEEDDSLSKRVTDVYQIRNLVEIAIDGGQLVEVDYGGDAELPRGSEIIAPVHLTSNTLVGQTLQGEERMYRLSLVYGARMISEAETE